MEKGLTLWSRLSLGDNRDDRLSKMLFRLRYFRFSPFPKKNQLKYLLSTLTISLLINRIFWLTCNEKREEKSKLALVLICTFHIFIIFIITNCIHSNTIKISSTEQSK